MKKTKNYLSLLLAALMFVFVASCGSENQDTDATDEVVEEELSASEKVDKIAYPLKTPFEIIQMLSNAGASYILDVTNPVEYVDKYFTEKSKALNLGIYGADLSYASTYNKTQETRNLLAATKKLTDELGIVTPFNESLAERIEMNIENSDSLYAIISDSYHDTFNFLNENGKGAVATLVLAGGWVEGLYLSSQLAILANDNTEILAGIAAQKPIILTLVPLLEAYKDNIEVQEVLEELSLLKEVYDSVEEKEGKYILTTEQFDKITSIIESLRENVVNMD